MIEDNARQDREAVKFRSGAAARLAGIPVETLRVWERRYAVVSPQLSPRGQRLYSAAEVRRLCLIKQLVDAGNPIGVIATQPLEALLAVRNQLGTLPTLPAIVAQDARPVRLVVIGPALAGRAFEQVVADAGVEIVGHHMNIKDAAYDQRDVQADAALIELSTLNDASVESVERAQRSCGAERVIVLYRFAPTTIIRQLRKAGHEVARAPADASEIAALCGALLLRPLAAQTAAEPAASAGQTPPAPRFDERALAELAAASTTVYCECPRHLADLVLSLGSFERYSAECANRGPADAAMHRDLERTAGYARALLEEALIRVAQAEGMALPASVTMPL
jgi:MerR family transcriptional regulator, light-induced transcriptional regulator